MRSRSAVLASERETKKNINLNAYTFFVVDFLPFTNDEFSFCSILFNESNQVNTLCEFVLMVYWFS